MLEQQVTNPEAMQPAMEQMPMMPGGANITDIVDPDEPVDETPTDATGLSEDEKRSILALFTNYRDEEKDIRESKIAFWKKLENYFDGIQNIFFDYGARDWRRLDTSSQLFDPNLYDKVINIYRAHGESIIAALSIRLPRTIFYPNDADVPEDIDTAKACNDIKKVIEKDNNGILLFIKALYFLWNQGVACAYIYNRASAEFGSISVPNYGPDVTLHTVDHDCPVCGGALGQEQFKDQDPSAPEMMDCPNCGPVSPQSSVITEQIPQVIGYTDESKSRTIIDIFGPMYAQMPFYARTQEQMPYIMLRFEQHENLLKSIYPTLREQISGETTSDYDRIARVQNQNWDSSKVLVTTSCCWFRPWAFEDLPEADREMMLEKYPHGVYAVVLNDSLVAEARDEDLDEHWQMTRNPLTNFIHADPLGKPLAPIQDIRNEAVDLAIETFEHAIPESFADPDVLNFKAYGDSEAAPGTIYQAKPKAGRNLAESFHTIKTATVNEEIEGFIKRADMDGQFVVGSFPSIYGGPATSGSKTAKEYSESRSVALQRLNTNFIMLKDWWSRVMACAVQRYMEGLIEDEKIVVQSPTGSGFVNKWIRQSELTGKIGRVECDAEEELPNSYAQLKSTIMELITLGSPDINSALFDPANSQLITKAIGIPDAKIPGADARNKQMAEIVELLKTPPMPNGMSTVMVNPEWDDHEVEMETIKTWANSPDGLLTKEQNAPGVENVEAHYMMHKMAFAQLQMQQMQQQQAVNPEGDTKPNNNNSDDNGDGNVE